MLKSSHEVHIIIGERFKVARGTLQRDHRDQCTTYETHHVDVLDIVHDSVMVRLELAQEAASTCRGRRTSQFDIKTIITVVVYINAGLDGVTSIILILSYKVAVS